MMNEALVSYKLLYLTATVVARRATARPSAAVWPGGDARLAISCRLLRFCDGSEETKEAFHPGDFESLMDALIHADQPQAASIFLPRDIGADQGANAG